jgi:hypothetical protein
LAQATADHRRREAAAASAELDLAEVQHLEDALTEETRRRAALAKAKRHKDALAAEERQQAAHAEAEQEASELAAIMALFEADMAQLQVLTSAALAEERRCHEAVLAAEADNRRRHTMASLAVKALTLVEERRRHKAVLAAKAND